MGREELKDKPRAQEHFNTINSKEMKMLITIMYKYKYHIVSAEKVRSVYKIVTGNGNFCLKKMKHGRNKAKNGYFLTEELLLNKFTNIAKYIRTKDGAFSVSYKKNIFYLMEWLDGVECDLTNIDEAVNCTKLLAEFHIATKKIDHNKISIPNNLKNWAKVFNTDLNNIEKFKRIILGKRIKNEFDILFMKNVDNFYSRGISSIKMLNNSGYYKASKKPIDKQLICHNSFYYQNIIKVDEEYFIIDLDSIMIDLQISDLGKLIRRLMFKKPYEWNFNFAKTLIEAYNSINKINREELEIMLALIIFPHKFCKLGKNRFIKGKRWSETKYFHKLNKIISYDEKEEKFFQDYLAYLEEYF